MSLFGWFSIKMNSKSSIGKVKKIMINDQKGSYQLSLDQIE